MEIIKKDIEWADKEKTGMEKNSVFRSSFLNQKDRKKFGT